jgi:hypothetical protein
MNHLDRKKKIESYSKGYAKLVRAIKKFPRKMWKWRGQNDPWTIHEIIVHIADSEANSFIRCRRFIAEPGKDVLGYDEMLWARELNYLEQKPEEAIQLFKWLRGNTYKLIKKLPEDIWAHTVNHSENGTMTMDDWLDVYDHHVPEHLAQMERIYEEWKATKGK